MNDEPRNVTHLSNHVIDQTMLVPDAQIVELLLVITEMFDWLTNKSRC